jgi:hypothetical protein
VGGLAADADRRGIAALPGKGSGLANAREQEIMSVKIHPMLCGYLETDTASILAKQPGRIRLPIPSFLIEHPKGRVVFDTGLHRDLQNGPERLAARCTSHGF